MTALILLAVFQTQPHLDNADADRDLGAILKRLDANQVEERDRAQSDLVRLVKTLGPRAEAVLRRAMSASTSVEVRARLEERLNWLARVAEYRLLLSPFDSLNLPGVNGARLVVYNTGNYQSGNRPDGPWIRFTYVLGWVVTESSDELKLSLNSLVVRSYRRSWNPPADWPRLKEAHPQDRPLPCEFKEVPVELFFRQMLTLETWKLESDDVRKCHCGYSWYEALALEPALYGWWALQCGLDRVGMDLVALGDRSIRQAPRHYGKETRAISEILTEGLADHLREQVIEDARERFPLSHLFERWTKIAALPKNRWSEEAAVFVSLYKKLLEEKAAWVEPDAAALAKRPGRDRAEYWVHRLRDHAPEIPSEPGECRVLPMGMFSFQGKGEPDAAQELEKLGWSALPALIDHFDDPRPTRATCFAPHNHGIPPSWILTVGDCCQIVFDTITRMRYSVWEEAAYSPKKREMLDSAKAKAEEWWKSEGSKGPVHHYLPLLSPDHSDWTVYIAARKLIESDPGAELPRVIGIARKTTDWSRRRWLFEAAYPFLGADNRDYLESCLKDPEDTYELAGAARLLWEKCGSDEGVRQLITRVERLKPPADEKDSKFQSWNFLRGTAEALPLVRSDYVAGALSRFLKHPCRAVREMSLRVSWQFPHPTVAATLAELLEDKTPFPDAKDGIVRFLESKGLGPKCDDVRLCDVAAAALASATGYAPPFPGNGPQSERDQFISSLGTWWKANGHAIKWKSVTASLRR
jgi:hypothetical protein